MGREALLESLRARAAEDRAALWRESHAAADAYRAQLAQVAGQERAEHAAALEALSRQASEDALATAMQRAREEDARMAVALGERCHRLATEALQRVRDAQGERLFAQLAAELPDLDWHRVEVNPADEPLAQARFPRATVVCDPAIHGGLNVETREGRLRISNSLDTRLAMAWPDLLPSLLAGLQSETG